MAEKKYKRSIAEKTAERFDIPLEAATDLPTISITGCRKVYIENHRGIIGYGENEISVNCGKIILKIEGSGLELRGMTDIELAVTGTLSGIKFEY